MSINENFMFEGTCAESLFISFYIFKVHQMNHTLYEPARKSTNDFQMLRGECTEKGGRLRHTGRIWIGTRVPSQGVSVVWVLFERGTFGNVRWACRCTFLLNDD